MIERTGESSSLCESGVAEVSDVLPQRKSRKTRRGKKKKLRYEEDDEYGSKTLLQLQLEHSPKVVDNILLVDGGENEDYVTTATSGSVVIPLADGGGTGSGVSPYEIPEKTKVSREQGKNRMNAARSRLLRPTDVPKAPENSTQFIIDDHEDCNLYFSFERRNLSHDSGEEGEDGYASPAFAGFRDIDYEYESPDDLVTSAFYEQDFENIYRHAREDDLLSKPRDVILRQYLELERRVLELETRIAPKVATVKVDPVIMIVQLQEELLRLQEENCALKSEKRELLHGQESMDELVDEDNGEHVVGSSELEEDVEQLNLSTEESTLKDDVDRP